MNRHQRRAATKRPTTAEVMSWPMLPPGEDPALPGRVTHMVIRHEPWCATMNGGNPEDCNCNPMITNHLQPKGLNE
jgi:hypothetical protein